MNRQLMARLEAPKSRSKEETKYCPPLFSPPTHHLQEDVELGVGGGVRRDLE